MNKKSQQGKKLHKNKKSLLSARKHPSRLLYEKFHRLAERHKKAVSECASKRKLLGIQRELDEMANMLQAMSSDWDV
jgi:hypothetical protein